MTNEEIADHVDTLGRMKCDRCGLPVEAWTKKEPKWRKSRRKK